MRSSSCAHLFGLDWVVVDKVQADLFELVLVVDFHLIFGMFSFLLFLLFILWRKYARSAALFYRNWINFTSSCVSTSSASLIETSDSDFVRSMADMAGGAAVTVESEKRVMAGADDFWWRYTNQRDPVHG